MAAHRAAAANDRETLRALYNEGNAHLFSQKDDNGHTPLDIAARSTGWVESRYATPNDALKTLLLLVNGGGTTTCDLEEEKGLGMVVLQWLHASPARLGLFKRPRIVQAFDAAAYLFNGYVQIGSKIRFTREPPLDITVAMKAGAFDNEFRNPKVVRYLTNHVRRRVELQTPSVGANRYKKAVLMQYKQILRAPTIPAMGVVPLYNMSTAIQRAIRTVLSIWRRQVNLESEGAIQVRNGLPIIPPELWYLIIQHLLHCVKPYEYSAVAVVDRTRSNFGGQHPILDQLLQCRDDVTALGPR